MVFASLILKLAPATYTTAHDTGQAATVVKHVFLQPQAGLVDCMSHAGHPLSTQSDIRAGLFGENLCESWRMEKRPFEFVGV